MNKYNSDSSCGFSSKLEAEVYKILKLKVKAGLINDLQCQTAVELTKARINCKIDFSFVEDGKIVFAEAKGVETDRWRIIQRLWQYYGPGKLYIYKGDYRSPRLVEVIDVI